MPLDPVARFHLGNGALIHALHADADTSENGQSRSHGVMVNYLYDLKQLEANHQKFVTDGDIACSNKVKEKQTAPVPVCRTQTDQKTQTSDRCRQPAININRLAMHKG